MTVSMTKTNAPTAFPAPYVPDGQCEGEHGYDETGSLRCGEPSAFLVDGLRLCVADAGMMAAILRLPKVPLVSLRKAAPVEAPRQWTYTTPVSLRADQLQPGMSVRAVYGPVDERFRVVEEVEVQLARVMVGWAGDEVDVFPFLHGARFELHVPTGGCQWVYDAWVPADLAAYAATEAYLCGGKVVAQVSYVDDDGGQGEPFGASEDLCVDHAVKAALAVRQSPTARLIGVRRLVPLSK